jgi:hypothetical protein
MMSGIIMNTKFFIRINKATNIADCYAPYLDGGKQTTQQILERLNTDVHERDYTYIEVPASCIKKAYGIARFIKFIDYGGLEKWKLPLSPELIEQNKHGL